MIFGRVSTSQIGKKYPPAGGLMSVVWKARSSDRAAGAAPQQVGHGADLTQI